MENRVPRLSTISLILMLTACTSVPTVDEQHFVIVGDERAMTGIYRFIDGDRFIYYCGGTTCVDTLIRDDYLQDHAVELEGKAIRIVVRRVPACNQAKTNLECFRSRDGSALEIREWIKFGPRK